MPGDEGLGGAILAEKMAPHQQDVGAQNGLDRVQHSGARGQFPDKRQREVRIKQAPLALFPTLVSLHLVKLPPDPQHRGYISHADAGDIAISLEISTDLSAKRVVHALSFFENLPAEACAAHPEPRRAVQHAVTPPACQAARPLGRFMR